MFIKSQTISMRKQLCEQLNYTHYTVRLAVQFYELIKTDKIIAIRNRLFCDIEFVFNRIPFKIIWNQTWYEVYAINAIDVNVCTLNKTNFQPNCFRFVCINFIHQKWIHRSMFMWNVSSFIDIIRHYGIHAILDLVELQRCQTERFPAVSDYECFIWHFLFTRGLEQCVYFLPSKRCTLRDFFL